MLHELAKKLQLLWATQDSRITESSCGHVTLKALLEARAALTTYLKADSSSSSDLRSLILQSDVLVDHAREMLHAYPYREVPACWRELYTDAGTLKALALGLFDSCSTSERYSTSNADPLKLAIAACDNVLVMAGASGAGRKSFVFELINALEERINGREETSEPSAAKKHKSAATTKLGEEPDQDPFPEIKHPIPRVQLPTMDAFQRHVHGQSSFGEAAPLIITGAIDHWPAKERWTDLDTLCRTAGPDRLVPIEIGSQYTDDQWTQKLVTMREFIQQYIVRDAVSQSANSANEEHGSPIGYLAQHDLFEQIPRLRRDIDIPDYCMIQPQDQEGYHPPDDVLLNAWFGPRGTVSPMHTDPYHNLLAQVVGRKYIRLYAPRETSKLYCYGSGSLVDADGTTGEESKEAAMLSNTSQVNVEQPDLAQHPLFADAQYLEAVLEPGELLYIPFQWWHYIRSLSTSFSVSFWF
ncbi:hypothetical protein BGZ70_001815 [Mortierella alpina]|uniref:JmjC domain-containing protein n=1 Tax=Mortierella alpina TaxID=64518 RepID=A0A9P6M5R0_MORAP|nr:hypothetical protein BGZ70_001815 [Mortierella alpina]